MHKIGRTFTLLAALCGSGTALYAQRAPEIVKWNATISKSSGASASVALNATIQNGWHVYALTQPTGGPNPLKISIPSGAPFVLQTPIPESKVMRREDPTFKMETVFYQNSVSLNLAIKKEGTAAADSIPVDVRFQACNDRLCLPPYTAHLTADLKGK